MRFAALGSVAASTLISRLTPAARPGRFGRERFFRPCGDFSRIEEAPAIRLLSTVSKSVATGTDYVGPYRLIRQLNSGLRMQVWEAKKDGDPERVVVKAINDRFRNDKEQLQHLKHEYEVGKELRNPHVIEIRELHTSGEIAYLVMEYFDALNLKQHLWQGEMWVTLQLPPIIENMAKGLEYLHRKGWVHRDIKPDNYLVAPDGMAKLIDFSLAVKIKRGRGLGTLLGMRSKVQGTRSYMSPEQIRGEPLDERSDIYSFGCMLFQLVGGKLPYTGANADDLLKKHLTAPIPSLQAQNPDVHPDFAGMVARMMAKTKDKRPENMAMFLREFKQVRMYQTGKAPTEESLAAVERKGPKRPVID
jgi:eukaryotic-like serine/threonine-protein kinase